MIAGCSIGAVVGGCYAAGKLNELEAFALSLTKRRVMGLLDFHISGSGLIAGSRVKRLLDRDLVDLRVESLPLRFAAIATELGSGHEVWLTRGPLVDAMRASYALPGIFGPVRVGERWLMDGALVNPIPVTAARALGADVVICVNLNGDIRLRGTVIQSYGGDGEVVIVEVMDGTPRRWGRLGPVLRTGRVRTRKTANAPGMATGLVDAVNITQDRIARSRLAAKTPDAMLCPKLSTVGLFEFHRAAECIELGRQAAERALPELRELVQGVATITL